MEGVVPGQSWLWGLEIFLGSPKIHNSPWVIYIPKFTLYFPTISLITQRPMGDGELVNQHKHLDFLGNGSKNWNTTNLPISPTRDYLEIL